MNEMKEDFPELRLEGMSTGDSGRARRLAQSRAIAKIHARRPNYDDPLVRAQMMALSVGGTLRGRKAYPGFEGVERNSFLDGDLYHRIGDRSVMQVDRMDTIEEEKMLAEVLQTYAQAQIPIGIGMRRLGYPAADIKAAEKQAEKLQEMQRQKIDAAMVARRAMLTGRQVPQNRIEKRDGASPLQSRPMAPVGEVDGQQ
jgi:hypothetical protein